MGRGDFGFDGVHSLAAVDQWIAVINANLSSTSRTGYKGSKVKFVGGVTEVIRNGVNPLQGIQLPESTVRISETTIDFSQGSVINSTEPTHLALQGRGFFRMTNGVVNPITTRIYEFFSRDGEFHAAFSAAYGANILYHSSGLYLIDGNAPTPNAVTVDAAPPAGTVTLLNFIQNAFNDNIFDSITPNFLRFSRFGSTVFEDPGLEAGGAGVTNFQAALGSVPTPIVQNALETSNTSLSQSLPELSLAQKFFSSISKVVSVHQTNLDTILNLVR